MVNDLLLWHGLSSFVDLEENLVGAEDELSHIESMLDSELSGVTRRNVSGHFGCCC